MEATVTDEVTGMKSKSFSRRDVVIATASIASLTVGTGLVAANRTSIGTLPSRIEIQSETSHAAKMSPTLSRVLVDVRIPLEAIRAKLESISLPLSGVEHDIVPGNLVNNDVLSYSAQRSPFLVSVESGRLVVRTKLAGQANAKGTIQIIRGEVGRAARRVGRFLRRIINVPTIINVIVDQPVSVTLDFAARVEATATATITENWQLNAALGGGAQLEVAEIQLGPVPLSLRGKLQPKVNEAVREALAKAERKLLEDDALRNAVTEQWESLHRDITLNVTPGTPPMVLSVRPTKAFLAQPSVNELGLQILVGIETETSIGVAPSAASKRPLPAPTFMPAEQFKTSGSIELNVPVRVPYDVLATLLMERLARGKSIRDPATGVIVTPQAVRFVPHGKALITIVKGTIVAPGLWSSRTTGEIAIVTRPTFSDQKTEIVLADSSLADLSVAWAASNGTIGTAAGTLLTAALAGQRFVLGDHITFARKAANDALAKVASEIRGAHLDLKLDEISPTRLEVADDAILVTVEARGSARLKIDDLRPR
jgi:hypothetical protein